MDRDNKGNGYFLFAGEKRLIEPEKRNVDQKNEWNEGQKEE